MEMDTKMIQNDSFCATNTPGQIQITFREILCTIISGSTCAFFASPKWVIHLMIPKIIRQVAVIGLEATTCRHPGRLCRH